MWKFRCEGQHRGMQGRKPEDCQRIHSKATYVECDLCGAWAHSSKFRKIINALVPCPGVRR